MSLVIPLEILQNLILFDTTNPPGNEAECIKYINNILTEAGFETNLIAKTTERPNLITRLKGQGMAPPLLLCGHVDVVTTVNQNWTYPPFEGTIRDGWIWGRGALDMKSGVSMMVAALLKAKAENRIPAGDVVLAVVCDEETGSDNGAKYLVENHAELFQDIRYALGEFGGFTFHMQGKRFYPIQIAEKQICWITVRLRGEGGHASITVRGGAMAKLANLLRRLEQHHLPVHVTPVTRDMISTLATAISFPAGFILRRLLNPHLTDRVLKLLGENGKVLEPLLRNTCNATIVHGGQKINVIPTEITLELDNRILPGFTPDDMIDELRRVIGDEVELELNRYDPCPDRLDMGLLETLTTILKESDPEGIPMPMLATGATDARFFSRLGIQTYGFTPMVLPEGFNFMQTIHAADERIPVEALDFGTEAVYKVLQRFGTHGTS